MSRTRKLAIGAVVLLVIVGLAAGGAWWYLRDDAPDEVSIDDAVASVEDDTTTTAGDGSATTAGSGTGIEGTWTVDTETGDFDFESATGSFVGFRIAEELASVGQGEAVGRTGDVTGTAEISGTTLIAAAFEADMTSITTNQSRRDNAVQDALDTNEFPTATFELTQPVDLGEGAASGEDVTVTATGDLTVHGVTRSVEVPLDARLVDGTIVVVGSVDIVFADYGVDVPSAPIVVDVEDNGPVELQLLLVRG